MVASAKPEKAERRRASGRRADDHDDPSARIAMLVIKEMRESRKVHEKALAVLQDINAGVQRIETRMGAQGTLGELRRAIQDAGAELESIRIATDAQKRKTG